MHGETSHEQPASMAQAPGGSSPAG